MRNTYYLFIISLLILIFSISCHAINIPAKVEEDSDLTDPSEEEDNNLTNATRKVDPERPYGGVCPPLCRAVRDNNLALITELLDKGQDPNKSREYWGETPLHLAAERGHITIATALLARGANIEATNRRYRFTPLHEAAYNSQISMVNLLIEAGANVNALDWLGRAPLHFAVTGNYKKRAKVSVRIEVVTTLLAAQADINKKDHDEGKTPLDFACDKKIKDLLIANGAKLGKELGGCTIS